MKLTDDVELVEGLPVAYIRSLDTLAVSDLHLGYEGAMAKNGAFIPKVNLKHILETLGKALDEKKAKRIMITGDIKNTFSDVITDELNELYDLADFLKKRGVELALVKTKHDNFVERYGERMGLKVYRGQAELESYVFFHGDGEPTVGKGIRMLVMGHEHPAIGITSSSGKRERLRCFLYGEFRRVPLLVLPAMGYFSSGTEVNAIPESELLSPIFRRTGIDRMHAIAIGYGSTIDFGKVSELRNV
jgi:hypothetical protein